MVVAVRSGSKTLSVWMVLVTVFGMICPRSILPKGTHM